MATTCQLYKNNSDRKVIGKTKVAVGAVIADIQLLDDCVITNPVVLVSLTTGDSTRLQANYMYIAKFGRYYFIDKITIINGNMVRYDCSVDVLESFSTPILALTCTIKRQQNVFNLYLDDPLFQSQNKRQVQTKRIGTGGFSPNINTGHPCFVLTVAGD